MTRSLLCATFVTCLALSSLSGATGTPPARQARVATGAKVVLVDSSRSAAQWSARRPQARELRPRVRGTFD